MRWWYRLLRRRRQEEELEKELRFHLDLHTSDLIARSYSPEEARRQARLALGGRSRSRKNAAPPASIRWWPCAKNEPKSRKTELFAGM